MSQAMQDHETPATRTGVWWWIRTVVSRLFLLVAVAILLAAVVVPFIGGAQPYTILTSSMEPTYPPGTLVVVREADGSRLSIGTVVTFQINSGEADVITHRIVATGTDKDGGRTYTTQGDANPQPDAEPVKPIQVRGTLWYSIPYLGYVNNWLTGQNRRIVVAVVAGSLFLYAAYEFVGAYVGRRKSTPPRRST